MNPPETGPDAIEAAAAGWLARRDRGLTPDETQAFAEWRNADPRHAAAVAELEMVWGALDDLSASISQHPAGGTHVVPPAARTTETATEEFLQTRRPSARWWLAGGLAAASLAVAAGWMLWRNGAPSTSLPDHYETLVGEQRKITLGDGSELQLNTDTSVSVQFTARERGVKLQRGEAFFQVAKNPARPFVVSAGRAEARVLGTTFVVRVRESGSELLVVEGKVKFGAMGEEGVNVRALQSASVAREGDVTPRVDILNADALARRLAWQSGRVEFKDTPLGEAVADFNRYHRRRLVLRDAAMESLRIGGAFDIDNLDGFVRLLGDSLDVVVVRQDGNEIILGLRP